MQGVVGLDLAAANTGMCFVPAKWDGKQASLMFEGFKTKKPETFGKPQVI